MHKCSLCRHAVSVHLSVCPSITFVYSVEMNKHIFKKISPSGSHTILVFSHTATPIAWQYSNGDKHRKVNKLASARLTQYLSSGVNATVLPSGDFNINLLNHKTHIPTSDYLNCIFRITSSLLLTDLQESLQHQLH